MKISVIFIIILCKWATTWENVPSDMCTQRRLKSACTYAVWSVFTVRMKKICILLVSILYKSIAGRYRPVRVADGPITARYRYIKNASWAWLSKSRSVKILIRMRKCACRSESSIGSHVRRYGSNIKNSYMICRVIGDVYIRMLQQKSLVGGVLWNFHWVVKYR